MKVFNKINIVPRWLIFLLDLGLCSISLLFSYFLWHNIGSAEYDIVRIAQNLLIFGALCTIAFINVKTYAGIIRYTSAQDTFRVLFAVVLGNGGFLFLNLLVISLGLAPLISNKLIIINALICFAALIIYRVLIKYFFMYIKNLTLIKRRVIIYGAGEAGLATKRTFDHDNKVNKTIVAFVDDDPRKIGKTIDGIKIVNADSLIHYIKNDKVDEIIFASYSIPQERKNLIIDLSLENDSVVFQIPPAELWTGGILQTRQIQHINIEDLLNRKPIEIDIQGIQNELKGSRILITGAAGSIGSEIVRQLMKFEVGLIVLCDQSETALHHIYLELEEKFSNSNFTAFVGDVRDEARMNHLFETYKPQFVFHAAAYKHVPLMEDNPSEAIKTNVLGTKTVADLSVKYGVQKFVMVSTDKAVNPTNIMGATKRIAEIYVQSLNNSLQRKDYLFQNGLRYINDLEVKPITKFITTRFGNVLGSNGSVIPRFKEQIEKGGPVTVTHPEITRFFMTIPEACRLVLEAGCMGNGGEIFIFDMGKSVKIVDLAKKMIRLAGLVPNQDIKIHFSGLRPGEKLYEELLNDKENTMPTHHEKIMIGKVREYEFAEIEQDVYAMINAAKANKDREVVVGMKKLVREFKSKNSIFEALDNMQ
ncbi:MAG: polysaccharide biosynthesis protein [Pedobacter sp.]|nr:MAG: polysaccharide biosynthesis protein [Pedobacter sp.]